MELHLAVAMTRRLWAHILVGDDGRYEYITPNLEEILDLLDAEGRSEIQFRCGRYAGKLVFTVERASRR